MSRGFHTRTRSRTAKGKRVGPHVHARSCFSTAPPPPWTSSLPRPTALGSAAVSDFTVLLVSSPGAKKAKEGLLYAKLFLGLQAKHSLLSLPIAMGRVSWDTAPPPRPKQTHLQTHTHRVLALDPVGPPRGSLCLQFHSTYLARRGLGSCKSDGHTVLTSQGLSTRGLESDVRTWTLPGLHGHQACSLFL